MVNNQLPPCSFYYGGVLAVVGIYPSKRYSLQDFGPKMGLGHLSQGVHISPNFTVNGYTSTQWQLKPDMGKRGGGGGGDTKET